MIVLSRPDKTPLAKERFKGTRRDRRSMYPFVVATVKSYQSGRSRITVDYEITTEKQIPPDGFMIEPFEKDKYTATILMNWHRSASAHDKELQKILNLQAPPEKEKEVIPKQCKDVDLWKYYIQGKDDVAGGDYSLIPGVVVPTGKGMKTQYACLASSILMQSGVQTGDFSIQLWHLYKEACRILNEPYLLMKKDKRAQLQELLDKIQKEYNTKQQNITLSDHNKMDSFLEAALRIRNTIAPTANLNKALAEIERFHGWKAVLETGKDLPLEEYREAVHKRIPIILQDNKTSQWLLAIGYLKHDGKEKLIIADPSLVDEGKSLHIDNQRLYPGACVYFEDFDPKKYTPYFIHNWHISVEHYKDRIAEIFKKEKKPDK